MLLVLVIGLAVFGIGAGLIKLNHYYACKRSNALARFVTVDVEKMLEDYTDHVMDKTVEMTKKMQQAMMESVDNEAEEQE